jgi:hypothetical protein
MIAGGQSAAMCLGCRPKVRGAIDRTVLLIPLRLDVILHFNPAGL